MRFEISGRPKNLSGPITGACSLAPTASGVEISGQVRTSNGRSVHNAVVTLSAQDGTSYVGRSNPFGYYLIHNVPPGETYLASVRAKELNFNPQVVSVADTVGGLDFVAEP